tara:strand:- start:6714 stop:7556 length:843 start_codon:yes stop_codon:yes gene_type:complete
MAPPPRPADLNTRDPLANAVVRIIDDSDDEQGTMSNSAGNDRTVAQDLEASAEAVLQSWEHYFRLRNQDSEEDSASQVSLQSTAATRGSEGEQVLTSDSEGNGPTATQGLGAAMMAYADSLEAYSDLRDMGEDMASLQAVLIDQGQQFLDIFAANRSGNGDAPTSASEGSDSTPELPRRAGRSIPAPPPTPALRTSSPAIPITGRNVRESLHRRVLSRSAPARIPTPSSGYDSYHSPARGYSSGAGRDYPSFPPIDLRGSTELEEQQDPEERRAREIVGR